MTRLDIESIQENPGVFYVYKGINQLTYRNSTIMSSFRHLRNMETAKEISLSCELTVRGN